MANIKSVKRHGAKFRERVDCADAEISFSRTDAPDGIVKAYSIRLAGAERSFEVEFSPSEWADIVKVWQ